MSKTPKFNPVTAILHWLKRNQPVNWILLLAYTFIILFMHETMVSVSVSIMNSLTLEVYNVVVAVITVIVVVLLIVYIIWCLYVYSNNRLAKLLSFTLALTLLGIHWFVMLEMNIEIIHAFMYAGLVFLIYPLLGRLGGAVIISIPIMLLDEWHQYQVLYPDTVEYFELNDVVLDILGGAIAAVFLWLSGVQNRVGNQKFWKHIEIWPTISLYILYGVLLLTCGVVLYSADACENTYMVMNQLAEPGLFWQQHPYTGAIYHVVGPIEGPVIILLLAGLLYLLDELVYFTTGRAALG